MKKGLSDGKFIGGRATLDNTHFYRLADKPKKIRSSGEKLLIRGMVDRCLGMGIVWAGSS